MRIKIKNRHNHRRDLREVFRHLKSRLPVTLALTTQRRSHGRIARTWALRMPMKLSLNTRRDEQNAWSRRLAVYLEIHSESFCMQPEDFRKIFNSLRFEDAIRKCAVDK